MYNKPGDKMKIYIELIYILNFLLDFMILYGTKRLLKISKDIKRQIYASILGSITTIFLEIKIFRIVICLQSKVLFALLINYLSVKCILLAFLGKSVDYMP